MVMKGEEQLELCRAIVGVDGVRTILLGVQDPGGVGGFCQRCRTG